MLDGWEVYMFVCDNGLLDALGTLPFPMQEQGLDLWALSFDILCPNLSLGMNYHFGCIVHVAKVH